MSEQTVVLIKPDGVKRGLVGEIISRFEKAGLKLVALKMVWIDKKLATKHYGFNDEWFENVGKKLKEFYREHGFDPGEEINKMSNRGDYSFDSPLLSNTKRRAVHNLIHASATPAEAKFEKELWFKKEEIYTYKRVGEEVVGG